MVILGEHKSGREVFFMKKYFVIIVAILVSVFAFGQLKDVPTDHWAYESVEALVNAGIITGYPDGTFRGASSVTRYEVAVLLNRVMEKIELDLGEVIKNRYLNSLKLINANKDQISALYKVVKGNADKLDELAGKFDELSKVLATLESLKVTLDVHEGDITALYDISGSLKKDLEKMNLSFETLNLSIEGLKKTVDLHEKDVINIYGELANKASKEDVQMVVEKSLEGVNGQIEFLYKKVNLAEENLKAYTDSKVDELSGRILNVEATVNDGMPVLRDLVYQNSTNIKNLEVKLMKYVNVKVNAVNKSIDALEQRVAELEKTNAMKFEGIDAYLNGMADQIIALEETKADKAEVEEVAKKVKTTNIISIFALLLGAAGLGVAIYGIMNP
jgi:hypothetical protein